MHPTALIDFTDPHNSAAPRLRHAFGTPREVLVAHTLAEVVPVLDAVLSRLAQRWASDDRIAVLVDSLTVKLRRSA